MQAQPQPPLQGPHMVPHTGMAMPPWNPPSNLQNPATPTLSHTHPTPIHPPIPAPTLAQSVKFHWWATFSDAIGAFPPSRSLNTSATAFVPRKPVTVKNPEGVEMNLAGQVAANVSVPPSPAGLRHGSPGTSSKQPTNVWIESEDQQKQRLAEERRRSDKLKRRSGRRKSWLSGRQRKRRRRRKEKRKKRSVSSKRQN